MEAIPPAGSPSSSQVAEMLQRAMTDGQQGRLPEAITGLEAVLAARPHLLAVELELARLLLRQGDTRSVVQRLEPALRRRGDELPVEQRLDLIELLVRAQLDLGLWQQAEPGIERLLQAGRGEGRHRLALARAALARGDDRAATAALERCVQDDGCQSEALLDLARLHGRAQRWEQAIDAYNQVLALRPHEGAGRSELEQVRCHSLMAAGERALADQHWSAACEAFLALEALNPSHPGLPERQELLRRLAPSRLRPLQSPSAALERFSQRLDALEALLEE